MRPQAGFSLIEILVVVALVGVFAGISAPMVSAGMDRYEMISTGQQVTSTVRLARFQAVARNTALRVRFDYPTTGQYQVVLDSNGTTAVGDVQVLPDGVTFGDSTDVAFNIAGRVTTVGGSTIVVTNGNADYDRTITVSQSGQVQLQ